MSSNYSAQQFDDAYLPHRLGNWEIPRDHYNQCLGRRYRSRFQDQTPSYNNQVNQRPASPYFLVSDKHGRLLPSVKEELLSRQGHAVASAWTQFSQFWQAGGCGCTLRRRINDEQQQQNGSSNLNIEQTNGNEIAVVKKTRFRVPIPSFFRQKRSLPEEEQRPTSPQIKVDPFLFYLRDLALPTIWIMGVPSSSIRQKWKRLCQEIANELDFAYLDLDDCIANWTRRQRLIDQERKQSGVSGKKTIPSITIPSYRNMKARKSTPLPQPPPQTSHTASSSQFPFPSPPITFSTRAALTTEKILDLLKFAMIESLPANGFVLDGFPCNLQEAAEFERSLYPASLILHFVPGRETENKSTYKYENDFEDPLIHPTHFRRRLQFTQKAGKVLSSQRNYGWKVIRVVETERVDDDTLSFLHQVIRDNLEREYNKSCPTDGESRGRSNYHNFDEESLLTPRADEEDFDINVMSSSDQSLAPSPRPGRRCCYELDIDKDTSELPSLIPLPPLRPKPKTKKGSKKETKVVRRPIKQPKQSEPPMLIEAESTDSETPKAEIAAIPEIPIPCSSSMNKPVPQKLEDGNLEKDLKEKKKKKQKQGKKKKSESDTPHQVPDGGAGDANVIAGGGVSNDAGASSTLSVITDEICQLPMNPKESGTSLKLPKPFCSSSSNFSLLFQKFIDYPNNDCGPKNSPVAAAVTPTEEQVEVETQDDKHLSPRKMQDPDERLLPLPIHATSMSEDNSWWCNKDVACGHKPKAPPTSPCSENSNTKSGSKVTPLPIMKPATSSSMESLLEWFDMDDLDLNGGDKEEKGHKIDDCGGDDHDTDAEFYEMEDNIGCGDKL